MFNISRFSPLESTLENLFHAVPVWPANLEARAPAPMKFRMDVTENEKEYQVRAELPGLKKEDISITISGNDVQVSAEVKRELDVKEGETVLRAERYFGKIQREFTFSQEIDDAKSQARYNDGVLELTLPKITAAAAKRLAVN